MKIKKFISTVISFIMFAQFSSIVFAENIHPYPPQRPVIGNMKVDVVSFPGSGNTAVVGLRTNGTVNVLGYETPDIVGLAETMELAKYETDVVDVACTQFAIALLKSNGTVKFIIATGHTSDEMYANPPYWTDIVALASGDNHFVGLNTDGSVIAFGDNSKGQSTVSGWSRVSKIQAKNNYTVGIRADGTVIAAGEFSNFNDLKKATGVTKIFKKIGYTNDLAYLSNGQLEHDVVIRSYYEDDFPTITEWKMHQYNSNIMEIYNLKSDGSKIIDADGTSSTYYLLNENGNFYELKFESGLTNYSSFELIETNIQSVTTNHVNYFAIDNNGQICSNEMAFTSDDWILTTNITYNGNKINTDVPPYIKGGRTLAPIRAILEALGMTVTWDPATKTAIAVKADTTINVTINSNIAIVNGEQQFLDIPAEIKNNRTFVPVRFFAEALNMNVDWDNFTKTVIIND